MSTSLAPAVLQVLPALGAVGGVERGTVDVAKALVAAGWRAVVASAGGPLVRELERAGARHVTLPLASKNPFTMRRNVGRLAKLIDQEQISIVHARSRAPAWSAEAAAKRTGVPFVTTFHGVYGTGSKLKLRYNAVMTRGERVIAISDFIARHMVETYGTDPAKIRVIHRGVDLMQFNPEFVSQERIVTLAGQWRVPEDRLIVMLPGRLSSWKGQDVLIAALARLRRRDLFTVMVGVGNGSPALQEKIKTEILRAGLEHDIRMIDDCRDMAAAYMLANVVVAPSTRPEAFGRTVTEAQAMGRPIIATDHGGARETIVPGVTGWRVAPGDAAALAAAIAEVLALDHEGRAKLGREAIAHVRANFTNEVMCAKTLEVYGELVAKPRAARADDAVAPPVGVA